MTTKYQLGAMDLYPILANRTLVENNPFLQAKLKEKIEPDRLYEAVRSALKEHPLFGCEIKYDKGFYLETLDRDFRLLNVSEHERPLEFGDNTDGFPWQICYYGNEVILEWCHTITDGRGAYAFLTSILCYYFGVHQDVTSSTELGLEPFYDKSEKGIPQKKQAAGHRANTLPYIKRGYKTDCHILKAKMSEVLTVAKKNDATPAAVIPPLFSMAMRKHMKPSAKNKNVRCNIVIDCRKPLGFETMHNCILLNNVTYIDRFDTMDFSLVSTIYRAILDLSVQRENIICEATKTVDDVGRLLSVKSRFIQKLKSKVTYARQKHSDSNFTFTYLGKMELPREVLDGLSDFNFRSWTDFGECNIAAIDFDGTLVLNICENYKDKGVVPDFIKACEGVGIHFEEVCVTDYEQANLRMKSI